MVGLILGTPGDAAGRILYSHVDDSMRFSTKASGGSRTKRLYIGSEGQIGLGGANYGTSGQVLTSNGSSSAPTWQTASGGSSGNVHKYFKWNLDKTIWC